MAANARRKGLDIALRCRAELSNKCLVLKVNRTRRVNLESDAN